jgi:hypothetical protein
MVIMLLVEVEIMEWMAQFRNRRNGS